MHTVFFFLLALAILVAFHEFGHYWVARRLGVKVLRFSLGFGKVLWRYRKSPEDTEFTLSAIPLGGYVKMVDEREGPVAEADLPFAFNRQALWVRSSIVAAGPLFNFGLAVLLYWLVFVAGETGMRPVLGPVAPASLAAQAGFVEGDEIVSVESRATPTWSQVWGSLQSLATDSGSYRIQVTTGDGDTAERVLVVPPELAGHPEQLGRELGFRPWEPKLAPVLDKVLPGGAAAQAGLQPGDLVVEADGQPVESWRQWVEYVRQRPEQAIALTVDREGLQLSLTVRPFATVSEGEKVGKIGATVRIPPGLSEQMQVEYRLNPVSALGEAIARTAEYSWLTVKMVSRMFVGQAALDNLSGPISIAQYAGQSASMGWLQFVKFLAVVSISLGVLNLLPVPVLDGGHLFFFLIEGVKGSPLSEQAMAVSQRIGMAFLIFLMGLALMLDLQRLLA
ncbi:RIP metalloprotease RseP [Methylogaea oryzae]|uniref:Zinc metalloprotease n=1 Tax=Methylogaea oryzae TaxID=1295382 RepID=A0A8D4VPB0_9GAMM|nr:RIP metalloprotease RseP [Methylogaea oryzae]BBL70742.1 regulator of sigma E protease [Methylogaea oryzae]